MERHLRRRFMTQGVDLSSGELQILINCMTMTIEYIGQDFDFHSRIGMEVEDVLALRTRLEAELSVLMIENSD